MVGANPLKNWSITVPSVTCNYLVTLRVIRFSVLKEPVTWGKPAGCPNSPWALAYALDCCFKELFLILGISVCIGLCWLLLAGNQVHFGIKDTAELVLLDQQKTFVGLTSYPSSNSSLFLLCHCFGSEEPTHCEPNRSMQVLSLASEGSRKWSVTKVSPFGDYMA